MHLSPLVINNSLNIQMQMDEIPHLLISLLDLGREVELSIVGPWLWKKMKIQEERRSTNCAEGTMTENGSKWSKK
jgi:hypothetical protein